jgi:hypothetical protein
MLMNHDRIHKWLLTLSFCIGACGLAWAANTALSGLSAVSSVGGGDLWYDVQSPGSGGLKATVTQLATYLNSTFSGDATVASGGAVTVAKTNGTAFGTMATGNFATPSAIGGTTPAAGNFTTLGATGNLTTNITGGGTQCVTASNTGVLSGTGAACGSGGGGTPCTVTANSIQYDNGGSFGCVSGVTSNGTALTEVTIALGSDATGDIYYRNSGGTLSRLGIGTAGQFVGISGGVPAWATPSGGTGCTVSGVTQGFVYNNGSSGCSTNAGFTTTGSIDTESNLLFVNGTTIPTMSSGNLAFAGSLASYPTFTSTGEGGIWLNSTNGLVLGGDGATNDFQIVNKGGTTVCNITTGSTTLACGAYTTTGAITGSTLTLTNAGSGNTLQQSVSRNGGVAWEIVNTSTAATALVQFQMGSSTSATEGTLSLIGSSGTSSNGANSFNINGATGLYLQGGGTNGLAFGSGGAMTVYNQTTSGTPVYAVCAAANANGSTGGALILDTSGTVCGLSTERAKRDIAAIDPDEALRIALGLRPVSFYYRDGFNEGREGQQIGMIAEEAAMVDRRLVALDDEQKPRGIVYAQAGTSIAIGAIKALERRVAELERKNAERIFVPYDNLLPPLPSFSYGPN